MRLSRSFLPKLTLMLGVVLSATVPLAQAETAIGYFVDSIAGSDSNDGKTAATPWKSLNKVNSTVSAAGADVWLLEGSTFANQMLSVRWNGTASNRATIGTYHMEGGAPTVGYVSRPAVIKGTYGPSCSRTLGAPVGSLCPFESTDSVPPDSKYNALVTVTGSYVTLQDLFITDSSGEGVQIEGDHDRVTNIRTKNTASFAIRSIPGAQYVTIENSDVSYAGIASASGDQRWNNRPHAILVQGTRPSYGIIQNNYVHETMTEGIQCRGSTFCIIRGNRISNVVNLGIYLDNASDIIVENNEIYGETVQPPATTPGHGWNQSVGIAVAVEETSNPRYSSVRNLIRNNLIANVSTCLNINVFPTVEREGWKTGGWFIGNTCLAFTSQAVQNRDPAANIEGWEIANNVFDRPNNGGQSVCVSTPTELMHFHNNAWAARPSDSSCQGPGDVAGSSEVSRTFRWTAAGTGNFPALSDWDLGQGSVAAKAGTPMNSRSAMASSPNFRYAALSGAQVGAASCLPPESSWDQMLATDRLCRERDPSAPSMGALESGGGLGRSYTLTVD